MKSEPRQGIDFGGLIAGSLVGGIVLFFVFAFVHNADWYQKAVYPKAYWNSQVTKLTGLLDDYVADVRS